MDYRKCSKRWDAEGDTENCQLQIIRGTLAVFKEPRGNYFAFSFLRISLWETPDREALAGSLVYVLGQYTLLSQPPLSTQKYKWVHKNCQGNLMKCWKVINLRWTTTFITVVETCPPFPGPLSICLTRKFDRMKKPRHWEGSGLFQQNLTKPVAVASHPGGEANSQSLHATESGSAPPAMRARLVPVT